MRSIVASGLLGLSMLSCVTAVLQFFRIIDVDVGYPETSITLFFVGLEFLFILLAFGIMVLCHTSAVPNRVIVRALPSSLATVLSRPCPNGDDERPTCDLEEARVASIAENPIFAEPRRSMGTDDVAAVDAERGDGEMPRALLSGGTLVLCNNEHEGGKVRCRTSAFQSGVGVNGVLPLLRPAIDHAGPRARVVFVDPAQSGPLGLTLLLEERDAAGAAVVAVRSLAASSLLHTAGVAVGWRLTAIGACGEPLDSLEQALAMIAERTAPTAAGVAGAPFPLCFEGNEIQEAVPGVSDGLGACLESAGGL